MPGHSPGSVGDGASVRQVGPETKRIQEETYQAFDLGMVSTRYGGTDNDIVLSAVTVQEHLEAIANVWGVEGETLEQRIHRILQEVYPGMRALSDPSLSDEVDVPGFESLAVGIESSRR